MSETTRWIGVDFDGTLAKLVSGGGLGDPVPAMLRRVKDWLDNGVEVRIFTVRAGDPAEVERIRKWLKSNSLPESMPVTNIKEPGLIELWDDRAIRVERNTGRPCKACRPHDRYSSVAALLTDC